MFSGDEVTWLRPASLAELLDLKVRYPQANMVVGNTEVGEWSLAGHSKRHSWHAVRDCRD